MSRSTPSASGVGTIFNVQRFSVHDGPGIRTTVFFKGCPLHCPWCHNPESLRMRPEVLVRNERCLTCGQCDEVCPMAHGPLGAGRALGEAGCESCRACVDVCPSGAREVAGSEISADEVVDRVLKDRIFFESSEGGVTFSGGEPMTQPAFLRACVDRCRNEGLHIALDTCGFAPTAELLDIASRVDLVLFDLKLLDPARHRELVGVELQPILDNLTALSQGTTPLWIRVPVVPGVNDSVEVMAEVAAMVAGLKLVEKTCLLPFHRIGDGKREALAKVSELEVPEQVSPLDLLLNPFHRHDLSVQVGG